MLFAPHSISSLLFAQLLSDLLTLNASYPSSLVISSVWGLHFEIVNAAGQCLSLHIRCLVSPLSLLLILRRTTQAIHSHNRNLSAIITFPWCFPPGNHFFNRSAISWWPFSCFDTSCFMMLGFECFAPWGFGVYMLIKYIRKN